MANQSIGGHGSNKFMVGLHLGERSTSGALLGHHPSATNIVGGPTGSSSSGKFKGHQRRQSVARLLPDISKLRLLSWLVEASSELINCDIAIMDGVYAKLNRSRESLLFWSAGSSGGNYYGHQQNYNNYHSPYITKNHQNINRPPPMPLRAPVAVASTTSPTAPAPGSNSNLKISQKQQKKLAAASLLSANSAPSRSSTDSKSKQKAATAVSASKKSSSSPSSSRNHFSLPLPNIASINSTSNKNTSHRSPVASGSRHTSHHPSPSLRSAAGSLLFPGRKRSSTKSASTECSRSLQIPSTLGSTRDQCDSNLDSQSHVVELESRQVAAGSQEHVDDDEDDDGHSSAASSTTSSGIHGGNSTSSSASVSGSSQSSSLSDESSCSLGSDLVSASMVGGSGGGNNVTSAAHSGIPVTKFNVPFSSSEENPNLSSAEQLSEKIRRTVMEHNYLQNLLVNVIRQHDRQRQSINQQHYSRNSNSNSNNHQTHHQSAGSYLSQHLKIDLADIADSIDDGCLCACHSQFEHQYRMSIEAAELETKASTLPALQTSTSVAPKVAGATIQVPVRKARRLKKFRPGNSNSNNTELSRQDIINQLGGKLCENCFETHYWLHGCSIELTQQQQQLQQLLQEKLTLQQQADQDHQLDHQNHHPASSSTATTQTNNRNFTSGTSSSLLISSSGNNSNSNSNKINSTDLEDLNAIITLKNATFIKLIQQQVRSTISKSIELIDLIRKEIKSPESIKQKQLMKCFSTSIQLLTSVGNYVVPTQDISTFIPEVGLQHTTLFCLPPSDFDYLLIYPSHSASLPRHISGNTSSISGNNYSQRPQPLGLADTSSQYHLASAPDIPIRRRLNRFNADPHRDASSTSGKTQNGISGQTAKDLSADLQRLRTNDDGLSLKSGMSSLTNATTNTLTAGGESSSGASSNNSSASSSIARGAVQQSSLIRAHTSGAILEGNSQQQHDSLTSFEAIANLSRQHTEDDMLFQSNRQNKFWQSSKFNFIKKLLHVKQQRLLRQQSKDRRIYNNKVQNKFRLVMRDLTHFNKSQQLLTTENGVNSLLTSMRNVLEFGLYLTLKLY